MKHIFHSLIIGLIIIFGNEVYGQCSNGSQPECTCSTAPVLCTIDSLDGYQFSMHPFQHPGDAPSPLCSGPFCSCAPHNPTWFAFTAWCTDLDLNVEFDNCQMVGASIGAQIAIYADCVNYTEVDCNVSAADCNTNDKMLNLVGLTIGQTYYFLIDGCSGSYCDVTIDVIGTCGLPEIEDWTNPISGEDKVCAGDTETYTVDNLDGANTYHWYVDGTEIGTSSNPFNDISWPTAGVYELCVDASQDPCVPVTDPPAQICMDVTVYDPDAGSITAAPNPLCPGETSTISISGQNTNADLSQYLIVVDPNNIVHEVVNGTSTTLTYDDCGIFTAYSYNFITADNPTLPVVGQNFGGIDCGTECCDVASVDVRFEDNQAPTFLSTPSDETIECYSMLDTGGDLEVQDNCLPNAFVSPTESGNADLCNGGLVTRTWEFTDSCGNTVSHDQRITVDPWLAPMFNNPPADITVDCSTIPDTFPDITYSNSATDTACQIMGLVSPVLNGTLDYCGTTVTVNWSYTDTCGNTISHDQSVTITPPPQASFVNPPADMTVSCANIPSAPPGDLDYTNNESGNCEISGTVSAMVMDNADECGGTITNTWEFTDTCSRTISHTQTITVQPASQASFVNPPADTTVDCSALPLPAPPDLSYTNNETGACEISGTISPIIQGTPDECGSTVSYEWEFVDNCNRTITHVQTITITPIPQASFVDLPNDTVMECNALPLPTPPDLEYTNGESGNCEISGLVSPNVSGTPDECGGTVTYTWEFVDQCSRMITHSQSITIQPAPEASFVNPPSSTSMSCNDLETGSIPDLDYTNNETGTCEISGSVPGTLNGSVNYCGGNVAFEWSFTDNCNRTINHSQIISVDPAPPATFNSSPSDITITCAEANSLTIPTLGYDNGLSGNCAISGTVNGNQSGTYNACGGNLTHTWTFTDLCGRTITEEREVTVQAAPQITWTNPPPDVTVDCDEVDGISNDLSYDNSAPGFCNVSGTIPAVITGVYDECGGVLTQEWTFMSPCGYTLTHSRTITVNPAPPADFVDPPADVTLACGETFPPPPDLMYTNNETGDCEISGTVTATVNSNGNTATYTWTFTDPCSGNQITHVQNLTLTPSPDLSIMPEQVTVCEGSTYNLNQLQITDANGTNPSFELYDGMPFGPGSEITDLNYQVDEFTTIYIVGSNSGSCMDTVEFYLITETPPNAGADGTGEVCDNSTDVPLYNFLTDPYDNNGFWSTPHSATIDISDPFAVNFNTAPPGDYTFYYIVPGTPICPADSAEIIITVRERPFISVLSIDCSQDYTTYTVVIEVTNNGVIFPSAGNVMQQDSTYTISEIPIDEDLIIDASLPDGSCFTSTSISAPDCDCPNVPLPQVPPPTVICEGESIPALNVAVGSDYSVNWYDEQTGGTLLASGTTSYTPSVSAPGVYSFYVESYSTIDSCLSSGRAEVLLEIKALPESNGIQISECGDNGFAEFPLNDYVDSITGGQTSIVQYYLEISDAEMDTNALSSSYENSDPNTQKLYIRVTSTNGCYVIDSIDLVVLEKPELSIQPTHETCLDAGDGRLDVQGSGGQMPYSYYVNGSMYAGPLIDSLAPGSYEVVIEDANSCNRMDTVDIMEGQEIDFEIISLGCNDNGTSTDSTDDFYTLTVLVTASLGGNYEFSSSDTTISNLKYGDTLIINIVARSTDYSFTVTDEAAGCSVNGSLTDLEHCSSDCQLTVEELTYSCNGNGTPTDPSDDYYDVQIIVSGINTGSNGQYALRSNGILIGSFNYDDSVEFTMNADGNTALLNISDSQITACKTTESIGPLTACSDQCLLTTEIITVNCDDGGTQNDNSDDTYTASIVVSGLNTGNNGWMGSGGINGNYGDTIELGPFLITNGNTTFTSSDRDKTGCMVELTIQAPPPCSQPCELEVFFELLECNNNGTGNDPTDDYYTIRLVVNDLEGPVTQYTVSSDPSMNTFGPFAYGDTVLLQNIPADGNTYTFDILDEVAAQCFASFTSSQDACSSCDGIVMGGMDGLISCDQTSVWLTASAPNANRLSWQGPNAFSGSGDSILVDAPGEYVVTAHFDDNCIAKDTVSVGLDNDIPVAVAGEDGLINCIQDSFVLVDLSNNSNPDIIRQWLDENGNIISTDQQHVVRDSGYYDLRLIDTMSQCTSAIDRVVVMKNQHDPDAVIFADPDSTFDCEVRTITLSTTQEENTTYFWTSGELSTYALSVTVSEPGNYLLIALDTISNCADTNSITLDNFSEYPSIEVQEPDTLSCIKSEVVLDATGSYTSDSIEYEWINANNEIIAADTLIVTVGEPGKYIFQSQDVSNGCLNTDTIEVQIDTSTLDLIIEGETDLPCDVKMTQLSVVETNDQEIEQIVWSSDSGTVIIGTQPSSITADGNGNYFVTAVHPHSGCRSTASVFVDASGALDITSLLIDSIYCDGQKGAIEVREIQGTPPYDIRLNNEPIQLGQRIGGLDPGTYTLTAEDANDCSVQSDIIFEAGVNVEVEIDTRLVQIPLGDSALVEAIVNLNPNQIDTVVWAPSDHLSCSHCLKTVVRAISDQLYEITVTDVNGCTGSALFKLLVIEPAIKIYIPNTITPNDDGLNENFTVYSDHDDVFIERMLIYDRWGNKMVELRDFPVNQPALGWDGTFKSQKVQAGVYVYLIEYRLPDGEVEIEHGDVTVLR